MKDAGESHARLDMEWVIGYTMGVGNWIRAYVSRHIQQAFSQSALTCASFPQEQDQVKAGKADGESACFYLVG